MLPNYSANEQSSSLEIVNRLIKELLGPDARDIRLTPDTRLLEIGFNSIRFIDLLLHLEDIIHKDIEVIAAEIDFYSIHTINDLALLMDKLK